MAQKCKHTEFNCGYIVLIFLFPRTVAIWLTLQITKHLSSTSWNSKEQTPSTSFYLMFFFGFLVSARCTRVVTVAFTRCHIGCVNNGWRHWSSSIMWKQRSLTTEAFSRAACTLRTNRPPLTVVSTNTAVFAGNPHSIDHPVMRTCLLRHTVY